MAERVHRKYGNKKTQFAGLTFDSKAEARRYGELQLLERAGLISNLRRQVPIELVPGVKLWGAARAASWKASRMRIIAFWSQNRRCSACITLRCFAIWSMCFTNRMV